MTIPITNLGAACCIIDAGGKRILTDPWFRSAYMGVWERSDYIADPVARIGAVDYVWISHLHEDHYDPEFLKEYLTVYPKATLWIGSTSPNYLSRVMQRDGFKPIEQNALVLGDGAEAYVVANHAYEHQNVDTALVVRTSTHAVVDLNDNPIDLTQVNDIKAMVRNRHLTILAPYSGAGPWPQCFEMSYAQIYDAAEAKKKKFLDQFRDYRLALQADVAVPFSAGYHLRGPLSSLNDYRGIPSQYEVPGATILPVQADERPPETFTGYDWEQHPAPSVEELTALVTRAGQKAPKIGDEPLTIRIATPILETQLQIGTKPCDGPPQEIITLDARLLHGLLTRQFHWNTCEISSALKIWRRPGVLYTQRVFSYLDRYHV